MTGGRTKAMRGGHGDSVNGTFAPRCGGGSRIEEIDLFRHAETGAVGGDALVGEGQKARIKVEVARQQISGRKLVL